MSRSLRQAHPHPVPPYRPPRGAGVDGRQTTRPADRNANDRPEPYSDRLGDHARTDSAHRVHPCPRVQGRRAQGRRVHLRLAIVARDRDRVHGARHREQSSETQHGSVAGRPGRQARPRRRADGDRDPALPEAGPAETAEKDPQVADGHRQHDAVVRHRARPAHPAVGTGRRRCHRHRRGQARILAGLPHARAVLRHRHIHVPGHGDLRRLRPEPAQQFLARLRHWIDTHTDQVIIIVSLVLGFWLVGNSIYYIVT